MKKEMKIEIEKLGVKVYGNYIMPDDGILYPLPLVKGNTKLGKTVSHSSTVPTNKEITCKDKDGNEIRERGTCPLSCKGCYGTTNNYQYNSTKYYLIMRTRLLRNHPDLYFKLVAIQLTYQHYEKLRIHAVGDFIPGEARGFRDVLVNFPGVKTWTYTKVNEDNEDIKALNALPNCNVVKSIIPGHGFNYGTVAYVANMYYYLKRNNKSVWICRCGIDPEQHCSDCDGCSSHEYVLFLEHSTKYNAKTDYGYDKFVELVNNQEQ